MRNIVVLILFLSVSPVMAAEESHYPWVSLGYSQDLKETDHKGGVFSGGLFPNQSSESDWGLGFQSYLEGTKLNDWRDDDMVYTLGVEPTLHWKWLRGGFGLAFSDRTTQFSGTVWNFSFGIGARYVDEKNNWFADVFVRHRSHCKACGIKTNKINSGMNSVNFSIGVRW